MDAYTLNIRDRKNQRHGGVLLYVPNMIRNLRRPNLERDGVEAV